MRIVSWNVNGLRAIQKKLALNPIVDLNPDLVCLQESKLSPSSLCETEPMSKDLSSSYHRMAEKAGYSGVVSFANKKINANFFIPSINFLENEGRIIGTHVDKYLIYNCYFPSGTSGEDRQKIKYSFLEAFANHLAKLPKKERERLILCGDFNICHKEIDIHHPEEATKKSLSGFLAPERAWIDELVSSGFIDAFRHLYPNTQKFTWWTYRANARKKNLGWRIDYFFVHKKIIKDLKEANIYMQIMGSDHCPISIDMQ